MMEKIIDITQASKLAFAHMKPGVITNHVMTAAEYRMEIEAGSLYAHTWPGGLLFLRGREGYFQLSYYLCDLNILPACEMPGKVFTEIAHKPSGADLAGQGVSFWERVGFVTQFKRVRLTRLPQETNCNEESASWQQSNIAAKNCMDNVTLANNDDTEACHTLLYNNFDRLTGYLPVYQELASDIENGRILCMKDTQDVVCGLLRFINKPASVEIRQLALRDDMRGQGLARLLLDAFICKLDGKKSTVWVRDGYLPALRAYNAAGFNIDSWQSVVMVNH